MKWDLAEQRIKITQTKNTAKPRVSSAVAGGFNIGHDHERADVMSIYVFCEKAVAVKQTLFCSQRRFRTVVFGEQKHIKKIMYSM